MAVRCSPVNHAGLSVDFCAGRGRMDHIGRRRLLLASAALALTPGAAMAQAAKTRRLGVLMSIDKGDPETKARLAALAQGLKEFGWRDGGNLRIDYRFADGDASRMP